MGFADDTSWFGYVYWVGLTGGVTVGKPSIVTGMSASE